MAPLIQKILASTREGQRKIPYAENKALADIISRHGVQHNLELVSIPAAKNWLQAKIAATKDPKQKQR